MLNEAERLAQERRAVLLFARPASVPRVSARKVWALHTLRRAAGAKPSRDETIAREVWCMNRRRVYLAVSLAVVTTLGLWFGPRVYRSLQADSLPDLVALAPADSTIIMAAD